MNIKLTSPRDMAKASVEWFVTLVVLALALRFLFRLFGAEGAGDGFVNWLYQTTGVLLQPVRGVYPNPDVTSKHAVEFVTLFAMVAYMAVGNVAMGWVERHSPKK